MKSKMKRRLLAVVLCMVIVLSNSSFIFASGGTDEAVTASQENSQQDVQDTQTETSGTSTETEVSAQNEIATLSETQETEATPTPEATPEPTAEPTATPTPEVTAEPTATATPEATTVPELTGSGETEEPTQGAEAITTEETQTEVTSSSEETDQQMEQSFQGVYEDDTVIISVSAEMGIVPEDAVLSVIPIEKTEITDDMTEEEKTEAEKINAQYDLTEKKLTENSEENEETMEGFLAYDISFLVNGEEVEPTGDVNVTMEFKEAAVPGGVSEGAEVSVKHLKKEELAEDGVVVENMDEKSTVQITDKAEVEKVELISDTFSTFTITWTTSGYSITVHYVNEKYQEITSGNVQSENIEIIDASETLISNYEKTIAGYSYNSATIGKPDEESGSTGVPSIYSVRVNNDGVLQYKATSSDAWTTWSSNLGYHVYLVYNTITQAAVIETVDNTEENITLHLFDYDTGNTETSTYGSPGYNNGINNGKKLKFLSGASVTQYPQLPLINQWTGDSTVRSGIVKDELQNGFPVLDQYNESLDYLFSTNPNANKKVYDQANHLFTKDADGYLIFDSDSNYAQFDTTTQNFTVYSNQYSDQIIGGNKGLKVFYPFNNFDEIVSTYISGGGQSFGTNGNGGWGLSANNANHYFGMTMSATFYQPENGRINGNDMVFEFSGDDDVWVFIDNQLVLDLGGIHDRASGSINFATGNVSINGNVQFNMYRENNSVFDGEFDDYSTHTINFFYLERGNNASNCKLKFNLPTIPEGSVMVTKQVTGEDNTAVDYAQDVDFQFVISKNNEAFANAPYEIRNANNQVIGTGTTDENGYFTLKHGQSAIFEGFIATDQYEVKEVGASLNNGYTVTIDSVDVVIRDETGTAEQRLQSASTGQQEVSKLPIAVFRNQIKDTATLSISKKIKDGSGSTLEGKIFSIRLWINGERYSGTYSVGGRTNIDATNGVIHLSANETAIITGLPYGVRFEVEEILDGSYRPTYKVDEVNTYNVSVPVVDEDGNFKLDENGNLVSDVVTASANISGNASVEVTNQEIHVDSGTTKLKVTKTWENGTDGIRPNSITVTLYQDNNNNGVKDEGDTIVDIPTVTATVTLNDTNNWTYTWNNLPADTNFVVEEGELDDFTPTLTLNSSFEFEYLDRVTTCSNLTYQLGKNNMLLVKLTSNSGYILWTPVDLGLSENEVQKIAESIIDMRLSGSGNLTSENLKYVYGVTDSTYTNGITLEPTNTGWTLKFADTSNWAQFWNLQYDRTINAEIYNALKNSIDIPVTKKWAGYSEMWENVQCIEVQLYNGDNAVGDPIKIWKDSNGDWTHTFQGLEKYHRGEDGNYVLNEYSVVETQIQYESFGGPPEDQGFIVEYSGNVQEGFVIRNIFPIIWQIEKTSSTDDTIRLGGAEFILTKQGESTPSYYGMTYDHVNNKPTDYDTYSNYYDDGVIYWWKSEADIGILEKAEKYVEDGTYILKEIGAPDGYLINSNSWTIEIEDFQVNTIINSNGQTVNEYHPEVSDFALIPIQSYLFKDTPYYELL